MGRHIIFVEDMLVFTKVSMRAVSLSLAADLDTPLQLFVSGADLYAVASLFTKLSLLWLYRRIFVSQELNRMVIGVTVFAVLTSITTCIISVVQCIPLDKLADPALPGVCIHSGIPFIVLA